MMFNVLSSAFLMWQIYREYITYCLRDCYKTVKIEDLYGILEVSAITIPWNVNIKSYLMESRKT